MSDRPRNKGSSEPKKVSQKGQTDWSAINARNFKAGELLKQLVEASERLMEEDRQIKAGNVTDRELTKSAFSQGSDVKIDNQSAQASGGEGKKVAKKDSKVILLELPAPAAPNNPDEPRTLTNLLPEIHLKIFDLLCPVNSTCLGLTCKKFYKIHREYHGTVSLMTSSSSDGIKEDGRRLGYRLKTFFDRTLHFNTKEVQKYITQERAAELRKKRWEDRPKLKTKRMSYIQRAAYFKGFQSEEEELEEPRFLMSGS